MGTSTIRSQTPTTIVVGLGETGLSCVRHLLAQGERPMVLDTRESPPGLEALRALDAGIAVHRGPLEARLLESARRLVLSPGISPQEPAVQAALAAGVEVVGDIELFARVASLPVFGITGTNGKSTTTVLLGETLRALGRHPAVGGNLGPPALDLLGDAAADCFVLELSSFQLETTESLAPRVAAVLNLSPDHLDRHGSMAAYAAAKARLLRHAECIVHDCDDPLLRGLLPPGRREIGFSVRGSGQARFRLAPAPDGREWLARGDELLLPRDALRLVGRHNAANALAVLAMAEADGLEPHGALDVLRTFPGLPHRCQWVAARDGVDWYDDSKGTNVGATLAAIAGFEGRPLVLVAGGQGKGQDFAPLAAALVSVVRAVVLLGVDAPRIAAAIAGRIPVVQVADMDEAVGCAARLARPGDAVLLSPACASLDMYADYAARGHAFARAVRERIAA